MDFHAYQQLFTDILTNPTPVSPYHDAHYINYVRLNLARKQRWLKSGVLLDELKPAMAAISKPQNWTVISEPWCGDAAHTIPFIHRLSQLNPLVKVDYHLRDSPPFLINDYLTNGSKSVPKLIIKNQFGDTLGIWGPRPLGCQVLYNQLLNDTTDAELKKMALQQWYNADKGVSFQQELLAILATGL